MSSATADRHVIDVSELFSLEQANSGKPSDESWVPLPEWGFVKAPEGTPENLVSAEGYLLNEDGKRQAKGCYVLDMTLDDRTKCRKAATVHVVDPDAPGGKRTEMDNERMEACLVTLLACDANGKRIFRFDQWEDLLGTRAAPVGRIAKMALKRAGDLPEAAEGK